MVFKQKEGYQDREVLSSRFESSGAKSARRFRATEEDESAQRVEALLGNQGQRPAYQNNWKERKNCWHRKIVHDKFHLLSFLLIMKALWSTVSISGVGVRRWWFCLAESRLSSVDSRLSYVVLASPALHARLRVLSSPQRIGCWLTRSSTSSYLLPWWRWSKVLEHLKQTVHISSLSSTLLLLTTTVLCPPT